MARKPVQRDLFPPPAPKPEPPARRYELPEGYGEGLEPLGLDTVPRWLRFWIDEDEYK
jgi:hypothetical protein